MGKNYDQFTLSERVELYRLHAGGIAQAEIARRLGRHRSSISRELARNSKPTKAWKKGYEPVRAHGLALRRRRWDCRFKLVRQPDLRDQVVTRLAMGWSPEQIAGRLARENGHRIISHESIYRFIYHRSAQKDYLHRHLAQGKYRRGRLGKRGGSPAKLILHRRPLGERPAEAADRATLGHWETDFMLFAKYGDNALVLHERMSRCTFVTTPRDRKAARTAAGISRLLRPLPKAARKTLAMDNGGEFALHHRLNRPAVGIETFFCDTHSPWQKGGVENAIGRLRRYLPRKTNLKDLTAEQLESVVSAYNNTPRKCLAFRTPREAFLEALQLLHFKRESTSQLSLG
jgi:IS30 family transposase